MDALFLIKFLGLTPLFCYATLLAGALALDLGAAARREKLLLYFAAGVIWAATFMLPFIDLKTVVKGIVDATVYGLVAGLFGGALIGQIIMPILMTALLIWHRLHRWVSRRWLSQIG